MKSVLITSASPEINYFQNTHHYEENWFSAIYLTMEPGFRECTAVDFNNYINYSSNRIVELTEPTCQSHYAPKCQNITKEWYFQVIRLLRDASKTTGSVGNVNYHLLFDNTPAHSSHMVQTFLANRFLCFVRLHFLPTWLVVNFSCSPAE